MTNFPNLDGVAPEIIENFHFDRVPFGRSERVTSDLLRLDGRSALVTGAGGLGSGNATCHRLAEQGASVAAMDINVEAAESTATAVRNRWGVDTYPVTADVGDNDQVSAAVEATMSRFGRIDILVNNAGGSGAIGQGGRSVSPPGTPFAEVAVEDIETIVRVNLIGTFLVTRSVLGHMLSAGSGRIINVASESGRMGQEGQAVYASCKAGVINFTRNLALEVGPRGISTVAVCPGVMLTSTSIGMMTSLATGGAVTLARAFPRISLGRASVPDESASVIAFLASEAGAYIHGTAVSVGGGMSA